MSIASLRAKKYRENRHMRMVEKCSAMRRRKADLRRERCETREAPWAPPEVRRVIAIIDLDSGAPMIRTLALLRGHRVDSYRVRSAKGTSRRSYGWSSVLAMLRERLPSPRVWQ